MVFTAQNPLDDPGGSDGDPEAVLLARRTGASTWLLALQRAPPLRHSWTPGACGLAVKHSNSPVTRSVSTSVLHRRGQCWHVYNFTSEPLHFSAMDSEPDAPAHMNVQPLGLRPTDYSQCGRPARPYTLRQRHPTPEPPDPGSWASPVTKQPTPCPCTPDDYHWCRPVDDQVSNTAVVVVVVIALLLTSAATGVWLVKKYVCGGRFLVHRYSVMREHAEANGIEEVDQLDAHTMESGKSQYHADSDQELLE
ncbi:hypothetical protein CRUP_005144 [Coryphaenoides rupestris]|nr:hypothetical protein CRUP_005144 [Coryphaenoides rupestris]